jgi:endonuclease YncB( thermonuclease family)
MTMRRLVLALACLVPVAAPAARFQATVSHVTDGDTVWVRPAHGGPPLHVRINGIDAPEICQAFGPESRDALATLVLHKRVTVITRGADDYQRTVARLRVGREDVGAWMVAHGYAWSYRFRRDPGPYAREETRARDARTGLWGVAGAEVPRDFRVRHGSCH